MDVETILLLAGQRQFGEEVPLRGAEFAARPFDDDLRLDVETLARIADRGVMVAAHGHGAVLDEVHDGLDRPLRIGAIADIVAEEHRSLGAELARLRQAGAERLPVGVNVGEQRDEHC